MDSPHNQESIAFVETPEEIVTLMIRLITHTNDALILDTGFGRGAFLSKLKINYSNLEGVELNKERFNFCVKKFPQIKLHNVDFLSWKPDKKFDVIIGNPPYMHYNELPVKARKRVTALTKNMESDIYYAFIIHAVDLLAERGELIFIVPYSFFYNTYADCVRKKLLRNGYLEVVIDLDENRLFKNNNPETVIFKFIKTQRKKEMKVLCIKRRTAKLPDILERCSNALEERKKNNLFDYFERTQFKLYDSIWSSSRPILIPEYNYLEQLADVNVGLVAGYSEGFTLTGEEYEKLPEKEKKVVLTFIKAKNCKGFWTEGIEYRILLEGAVKTEKEIRTRYPTIYKKLLEHKGKMSKRYLPNLKWWNWLALRNKTAIERQLKNWKIFVPTLDRHKYNRFSLTKQEVYSEGDTIFLLPKTDPFFLIGYLNSTFFRKYYLSHGARRGQRIAFTQAILSKCKVPYFTKEINQEIKKLAKKIYETHDHSLREEIDKVITRAFKEKKFRKVGITRFTE